MFSVTDTGCGLTPEESKLLFQRFAQGKSHSSKSNFPSNG
jgi:signal transduction histidine kinase